MILAVNVAADFDRRFEFEQHGLRLEDLLGGDDERAHFGFAQLNRFAGPIDDEEVGRLILGTQDAKTGGGRVPLAAGF